MAEDKKEGIQSLFQELYRVVDELRENTPSQANTGVTRKVRDHTHQSPEKQLAKLEKLLIIARQLQTAYTASAHKSISVIAPAEIEDSARPTSDDNEHRSTASASGSPVRESVTHHFYLPPERMGGSFPQSIAEFYKEATFNGRFTFNHDVAAIKAEIQNLKVSSDYDQLAVQYRAAKPFPILQLAKTKKFHIPKLDVIPSLPESLSESGAEAALNKLHSKLPKLPIPYYTGPCATARFGKILCAGKYLDSLSTIPGLNTTYIHMGEKNSGTPWHVEDLQNHDCRSVNMVYIGYKLFVLISPEHQKRFEIYIKHSGKSGHCAQFIRYYSIFVSPEQLRSEEISFTIHCLGSGDGIVILPGQYYMVVNLTMNIVLSINFTLLNSADSYALLDSVKVYKMCGLSEYEDPLMERVPAPLLLLYEEIPLPATAL